MCRAIEHDLRPVLKVGRVQDGRAGAIQHEMDVAVGGALRDEADRHGGGVGRECLDLDVNHRGEAAQALRSDAERVDLLIELKAHLFVGRGRPARLKVRHVDRLQQRLLGEQHGLLATATDAKADHAGRAPSGAELR